MTSRLTSEARMPSWPMEMPSLTVIVPNSIGKPPAARTPSLACSASLRSVMLHGVTSFHDEATPTCGLPQSSSVMPTARSIARAGAFGHAVGDVAAAWFDVDGSAWFVRGHAAKLPDLDLTDLIGMESAGAV